MFIASLTILLAIVAVFSPGLMGLYIQWAAEPTSPAWFHNHPYSIPMGASIMAIILAVAFFIYASIREYRRKKNVAQEQINAIDELQEMKIQLEKRLDSLERRLPNDC